MSSYSFRWQPTDLLKRHQDLAAFRQSLWDAYVVGELSFKQANTAVYWLEQVDLGLHDRAACLGEVLS